MYRFETWIEFNLGWAYECTIVAVPLFEKAIFPPLNCSCMLIKNLLGIFMWVIIAVYRSPTPATRDSTWRDDGICQWDSLSFFYGLPVYSKFKILFYTFTKTLGQRFDIFSSPSPRIIISINHCCSSNRVSASVIVWESALSSTIYLF